MTGLGLQRGPRQRTHPPLLQLPHAAQVKGLSGSRLLIYTVDARAYNLFSVNCVSHTCQNLREGEGASIWGAKFLLCVRQIFRDSWLICSPQTGRSPQLS